MIPRTCCQCCPPQSSIGMSVMFLPGKLPVPVLLVSHLMIPPQVYWNVLTAASCDLCFHVWSSYEDLTAALHFLPELRCAMSHAAKASGH
jgi:hypothetical protein